MIKGGICMQCNLTEKMNFDTPIIADKSSSYFKKGEKPFFWLGDTAWLLFHILSDEYRSKTTDDML